MPEQISSTPQVKSFRVGLAFVIATACGAGFFPKAPGTMGTLVAMPLAYMLRNEPDVFRAGFWIILIVIGTWAAKVFDEVMKTNDNQNIVIDEVIGLGISSWTAGDDMKAWVLAFILFRIFDVLKPFPVRNIDRWSKKQASAWWKGFGVIADDIVAAFQALAVMVALQHWHVLL